MNSHLLKNIFLFSISLFLLSSSCEEETETEKTTESTETKVHQPIEDLIFNFDGDYEDLWTVVDSLQNIGLYESALKTVEVIFDSARVENNVPQVVKSVIHKMKYNSYLKEDDYVVAISELDNIAANSKYPLKQIIHSVNASVYWSYYEANRWRIINRTQTVQFENKDIRTWDLNTIADHVNKHYLLSLTNKDSLQHTSIHNFNDILSQDSLSTEQRPTLYDFLAHRAINYFQNTENTLVRPVDRFVVSGAAYFGEPIQFMLMNIESTDSMSNHLYATKILRSLTEFHINDKDPTALIDLELRRIEFAHRNSVDANKSDLYEKALKRISNKYDGHNSNAEVLYKLARYYNNQTVDLYDKEAPRDHKIKALKICNDVLAKYKGTLGADQCAALRAEILAKDISFNQEASVSPTDNGKVLLSYRNMDSLYFRLVKVNWDYYFRNYKYGVELMEDLLKKPVVRSWKKSLTNPQDYLSHTTEIKIDPIELGQYVLLASADKNFSLEDNAISYSPFWSTNLSYTYRRNSDETIDVLVTDRSSGEPLKNVTGVVYKRKYSYISRDYELQRQESYKTDDYGMFTISSKGQYRYIYVDLSKGDDRYNNSQQLYQYRPYKNDDSYTTTHFFTDRNIYRPGQTIHFKGIMINHDGDNHTIATNNTSVVELYDVNYQKVADLTLKTNEYGTFSGTFTAPMGVLNGQMHLQDKYGSKYFSVEEYKRPKFEVSFEPITGVFKIGQKVSVEGKAKAFAGSSVDGAEVQYRITRNCNFPSWTWYRWGYYPYAQSTEIENGQLTTDEDGNFKVEFTAKEDPSVNKKYYPYYSYQITADVTDINGETHSTTGWVTVGYNAMSLNIGMGGTIERSDHNRFKVNTMNLNGEKVEAQGKVTVTKLIEPEKVFRNSLWEKPDIQEFSKEEYYKYFPHDVYSDENEVQNFKKGEVVFNGTFNTAKDDSITINNLSSWKTGRYVVESNCIDAFGEPVKEIKYLTVLDKKDQSSPTVEVWKFTPLKDYCEPGEKAQFLISSATDNMTVLYEIEHKDKIVKREKISINKEQKLIEIPIEEKHRGNLTVHFTTVKYGRSFVSRQAVIVPYSNKELDIKFETFRNKLLPGQKEEWRLRIKGLKGDKVAAEMLAAMYDASLDEFAPNSFYMNVFNSYYSSKYWYSSSFNQSYSQMYSSSWNEYISLPSRQYYYLNWWGHNIYYDRYGYRSYRPMANAWGEDSIVDYDMADQPMEYERSAEEAVSEEMDGLVATGKTLGGAKDKRADNYEYKEANQQNVAWSTTATKKTEDESSRGLGSIKARSNMNETAFFYPHLETDSNGDVIVKFTIPEALTKWKFLGMAHTKDLKTGYIQEEVVTQKELMVMPNAPRFFREGDRMTFTAKVSNLAKEDLDGTAQLMLFDALTMKPIDDLFSLSQSQQKFSVKKGQSARLAWDIKIPFGINAVTYRVVAKAKNHTDGEENAVPVLSNRMLVTESMPLPSKGIGMREFTFNKLLNSSSSSTIKHHKLTLEYTSNPAWYAVQAMPYMMEYPYECSEQIFTRFYSNSIASHVVNSNPKIKQVFESWKQSSPDAFLSNLQKNQELKSLILEETPWVLDAKNESERKKRVALLFDLNKMDNELSRAIRKLRKMQVSNGGWPWFPGMKDSRYITQHIITGMGHLDNLGVKNVREDNQVWQMVTNGVQYLDQRIIEDYEWLKKHDPHYLTEQRIGQIQVQYLYARSYFKDISMSNRLKEAFEYYQDQAATYWKNFNLYNEGMIALQAHRYGVQKLPGQIIASLKERAIVHEEMGMYWKDNIWGYYWYQAPIETQALLIEAFDEVTEDQEAVEEMKIWLLKQKQTTDWKTTKATVEACYALFLRGTDLLANDEQVEIFVNDVLIDPKQLGTPVEAGTGYFKTSWSGNDVKPAMAKVKVNRKSEGVSWGAMYWQYFEDLDKITPHDTPLKLEKKLFLVVNTNSGPVIKPVTDETKLKPGDKVRVRIELRSDRDMEYVHMKDMRAAGFEPVNVFSRYKWQDGLGYYESTKDAATNFFMDYLPKGTYVFEYDLRVSHYGDFSNGITTIQCMYAPEFTSHSEGIRVKVEGE